MNQSGYQQTFQYLDADQKEDTEKIQIISFEQQQEFDMDYFIENFSKLQIDKQKSEKLVVEITLIDNTVHIVTLNGNSSGRDIRQYIQKNLSNQLDAFHMAIYCNKIRIKSLMKLQQFDSPIKIVQKKINVNQIKKISGHPNKICAISEQKGVAKMGCGHQIGRDSMYHYIKSQVSKKRVKIVCPFEQSKGIPCGTHWPFTMCSKVGVFTKSEAAELQEGLSNNWIKRFCKDCPNCGNTITKNQQQSSRVYCPSCRAYYFCFYCLNKWKSAPSSYSCGNEECNLKVYNKILRQSPWTKIFELQRPNKQSFKKYKTPRHRACVYCNEIIEHETLCKHMLCKSCLQTFCWVCLSKKPQGNKKWKCEAAYQYCGKIAPTQRLR